VCTILATTGKDVYNSFIASFNLLRIIICGSCPLPFGLAEVDVLAKAIQPDPPQVERVDSQEHRSRCPKTKSVACN
jgi:hypothetical protein